MMTAWANPCPDARIGLDAQRSLLAQLRLGLWPRWRRPVLIPVELLRPDGFSEHQRCE
jgi:hypothetical protein